MLEFPAEREVLMRTLIIDNYDSFTYNLFHYMAEVTGAEPVVLRNDHLNWTITDLEHFDNVIISPGPGRPDRPADFGICAEIIRDGKLPLLGVCLGHQGICQLFGAAVRPASEVYHGRRSPVLHDQVDILAGLPSPFSAVRYHSLIATDLSADLEPMGWTPEGVLMAVRHRNRPLWGVQFHPESICTEYGQRLLGNFADLTRQWHIHRGNIHRGNIHRGNIHRGSTHRGNGRRPAVAPQPVRAAAATVVTAPTGASQVSGSTGRLRLLHRRLPLDVGAEAVFDLFYRNSDRVFWLDSSLTHPRYGRFSFMGDAAGPLARVATADVWTQQVRIESAAGVEVVVGGFLDWIDADLRANRLDPVDLPFDFALGWVGYLGYELKAECAGDRVHRSEHPDAAMLFADRAVVFDHREHAVYLLALAEGPTDPRAHQWLAQTTARLEFLAAQSPSPRPDTDPELQVSELSLRHDRSTYLGLIATCQQQIRAGETYEVCLTNMLTARGKLNVWNCYRLLRHHNPAPFAAGLRFGALSVLSCSPERFLRISSDGIAESRPIKGTRPRSGCAAEDQLLRAELHASVKDHAENLMIVDLVRNDLGSCAELGSVRAEALFEVESYATVHQLVSTIQARLRADRSTVDCVRAAFPGGSMTGAPKIRTMQIIDQLEDGPRGVYSGALGYFSLSGAADLSIVIRTLVITPGRIEYGVGGAIIALSDAATEFEETAVKATPLLSLLGEEFPGRSVLSAPSGHG